MKKVLLASTSTLFGSGYLDYILPYLETFFSGKKQLLFIPYARPGGITYDAYTEISKTAFSKINIAVNGIHEFNNPIDAIQQAEGFFIGGGNTFVLLNTLYNNHLMKPIQDAVAKGIPYFGTSAGSNICGQTICTTNDMPIQYPPSFNALGIVPFNINPHYIDHALNSTHMGETRDTRIREFHFYNNTPVVALREGSWLEMEDKTITLKGNLQAKVFETAHKIYEIQPNSVLSF